MTDRNEKVMGDPPPTVEYQRKLGKYELGEQLGAGGMGTVHKAWDPEEGRFVAVKILPQALAADEQALRRFEREARVLAAIESHNIVPCYEVGCDNGTHYLVMGFVEDGSAADLLRERRLSDWRDAIRIVADACSGLVAAHKEGVIHRDIKPANILLNQDGSGILADFGLAKSKTLATMHTATGAVLGTPAYMAPEQVLGQEVDVRTDVYLLGATLFELLTGETPYAGSTDNPVTLMQMHVSARVPDPREIKPEAPEQCAAVVMKAMAKKPESRYQTAEELHADLAGILEGTETLPWSTRLHVLRRRWIPRLRAVGLGLLALFIGYLLICALWHSVIHPHW